MVFSLCLKANYIYFGFFLIGALGGIFIKILFRLILNPRSTAYEAFTYYLDYQILCCYTTKPLGLFKDLDGGLDGVWTRDHRVKSPVLYQIPLV